MERQFTSTCYLVHQEKFLLLLHPKHNRWLPPGGHLESGETPAETARREVWEETGLEIAFYLQENLWIDEWNATSIERPFSCLLESIPARKGEPAHQHIDFVYVGYPIGGKLKEGRWFSFEEVEELKAHEEVFLDTQVTIRKIRDQLPTLDLLRNSLCLKKSEVLL